MTISENDPEYSSIINSCFRYLGYRPRSEKEMVAFIRKKIKSDSDDVYKLVYSRLKELGYIDDYAFCRWWINARRTSKPKGKRQIIREIMLKGVDRKVCEAILNDDPSGQISEKEYALRAIKKLLPRILDMPHIVRKKKLYWYLARRGFDSSVIVNVIDEVTPKDYNM